MARNSILAEVLPERSRLMSLVRRKGTKPERVVAAALRELGLSYRLNVSTLPGSPDFANKSSSWAIFVNGCYWHHHSGCRKATIPKTNTLFWLEKFKANRKRDAKAVRRLRQMGFDVLVIWECETIGNWRLSNRLEPLVDCS